MTAVLAIDAAWTEREPSGVAVLARDARTGWRCAGLAPSYAAFIALAAGVAVDWSARSFTGDRPAADSLLAAAEHLAGQQVGLVTVDMPVSTVPISGRRAADNAVSKAFGRFQCGTHTPNPRRPGAIGRVLSEGFTAAGYPVATTRTGCGTECRLTEVYPHPALVKLLRLERRLPYKQGKSTKYWPGSDIAKRIRNLLSVYDRVLAALTDRISGIGLDLPHPDDVPSLAFLKRYEDALDALVCGWVGIEYLRGRATPYGDKTAAIWIPA